jgi:hypothetical protein
MEEPLKSITYSSYKSLDNNISQKIKEIFSKINLQDESNIDDIKSKILKKKTLNYSN